MLSIFSYVAGSFVHPPWRNVWFISFVHFLIGLSVFPEWSRVSCLYILEIKPLSESIIGKYVFPYSWFPFYFAVFFSHAEAFYFDEIHLFIPSFMSLALGDIPVKTLLHGISEIFLPISSCMTFIVSRLIFKSFIHLGFIFVYKLVVEFRFFASSCPALPTPFVEEAILIPFYVSVPFVKYLLTIETWVYFCAFYCVPLISVSVLMPVPDCFN
ncbi:hypothetical protein HJG60_011461 [Phyllostomus discolor]|uniref:Uncharacterized protein n=1 Tax=Phyllostomus discolor TaxID=89673 RepID=A0A833ZY03_9CHIR|nr:hypothetical protein HJG60_011461 [Phyllostomus discolor]